MDKDQILARWIAEELSDTELKTLVSKEEYVDFIKLREGISLYEMTQKPLSSDLYKNIEKAQKKSKLINLYRTVVAVAAAIVLLLSVNYFMSPKNFEATTAYGEYQKITLPDGSIVHLGAKSELSYNKSEWKKHRNIQLQGKAYFEVKKGGSFNVTTPNGQIKVVGTKFSVNSFADYFNVKCFEGKVKVITNKEMVLKPYEVFQKTGNFNQQSVIKYNKPLWLSGESRFQSTPLKYVLIAIEKQYGIHFIKKNINDNKLFTGSFRHDNLDLTLKIVLNASNIKIKKKDVHTYVLTKQ